MINDLNKPLRKGYIENELVGNSKINGEKIDFKVKIYVNELDRYTSGESKIKIDYIEPCVSENDVSHHSVKDYITDKLPSVFKTSDINWLESETAIKDIRKEKLKQISNKFKF